MWAVLIMSLVPVTFAATNAQGSNCDITIKTHFKSGKNGEMTYSLFRPTRKSCEKAAKQHHTNFAPKEVLRKIVSYKWRGK